MRGVDFDPPSPEDTEWFDDNIAPLHQELSSFARQVTTKQDFAQEALQDALITLWANGRGQHDPSRLPVREYARSTVWGWVRNNRQERKRAQSGKEVVTDPFELPPEEESSIYAGTHHVECLLSQAEDLDQRTLLFMYHVERLSQSEIARREGISQQAVAKRLQLAHKELQAIAHDWL